MIYNKNGSETLYFIHTDFRGAVVLITDDNGKVVWSAEYTPYGEAKVNEDPDNDGIKATNNLRLPGQYFDNESGLHYNVYRYYDPQTGQYISPDPLGNGYIYADGDPINLIDPLGLKSECGGGGGYPTGGIMNFNYTGNENIGLALTVDLLPFMGIQTLIREGIAAAQAGWASLLNYIGYVAGPLAVEIMNPNPGSMNINMASSIDELMDLNAAKISFTPKGYIVEKYEKGTIERAMFLDLMQQSGKQGIKERFAYAMDFTSRASGYETGFNKGAVFVTGKETSTIGDLAHTHPNRLNVDISKYPSQVDIISAQNKGDKFIRIITEDSNKEAHMYYYHVATMDIFEIKLKVALKHLKFLDKL